MYYKYTDGVMTSSTCKILKDLIEKLQFSTYRCRYNGMYIKCHTNKMENLANSHETQNILQL